MRGLFFILLAVSALGTAAPVTDKDWFVGRLVDAKVKNVEEALALIQAERPRLLVEHILVHNSMSCQGSSFEKPRALLTSGDGTFTVTFTDKAPANHALEVSQYHGPGRGFSFYDLDFTKKPVEAGDEVDEKEFFNLTQPADCLRCHGGKTRAVPGKALLGVAGFFANIYGSYQNRLLVGSLESDQFLLFLDAFRMMPNYSRLRGLPSAAAIRERAMVSLDYPVHRRRVSPNEKFLKNLERLNGERILHMIETHPRIATLKHAVLAAFLDCPDIQSYVKARPEVSYESFLQQVKKGMIWAFNTNYEMYSEANPVLEMSNWHLKHAERVAKLRFVLEPDGNFAIDDWSLDNLNEAFAFGEESGDSPLVRLLPAVQRQLFGESPILSCAALKRKSVGASQR